MLRDTSSVFTARCSLRLREIFSSARAMWGEHKYATDDISKVLEFVEKEINEFDEVIQGHGDFCALVATWGTANIFAKARCKHLRDVNKPTFTISPANLENIPSEAQSVGNRFITQIWAKGDRELTGNEARALLDEVWNYVLTFWLLFFSISNHKNTLYVKFLGWCSWKMKNPSWENLV